VVIHLRISFIGQLGLPQLRKKQAKAEMLHLVQGFSTLHVYKDASTSSGILVNNLNGHINIYRRKNLKLQVQQISIKLVDNCLM
jgi:hypothetical protein